jgi:hypothetical protein
MSPVHRDLAHSTRDNDEKNHQDLFPISAAYDIFGNDWTASAERSTERADVAEVMDTQNGPRSLY